MTQFAEPAQTTTAVDLTDPADGVDVPAGAVTDPAVVAAAVAPLEEAERAQQQAEAAAARTAGARSRALAAGRRSPTVITERVQQARVAPVGRLQAVRPLLAAPYPDADASTTAGAAPDSRPAAEGRYLGTPSRAAATVFGVSARELEASGTSATKYPAATDAVIRHLLNRATFGPRPNDFSSVRRLGIDGWIKRQLSPFTLPDTGAPAVDRAFPLAWASIPRVRESLQGYSWEAMGHTVNATIGRQLFSGRQLYEVVADVMANLLNVTCPHEKVWDSAGDYQATVIRRNAMGKFRDMLVAAGRHPAMLSYLDNADSRGRDGVNENYGRELLELHTVGVASGYTETDVRNSAYILSGRSIDWETGRFLYRPDWHATGRVRVLGFTAANTTREGGFAVGDAYLRYLAGTRATARRVSRALAVRLVSDNPSAAFIDRLASAYLYYDTSIAAVLRWIFASTEFWQSANQKVRRPMEDLIGTVRALATPTPTTTAQMQANVGAINWALDTLGHRSLGWQPPNGYPDVAGAWQSASGMVQRWNAHRALANGWWGGQWKDGKQVVPSLGPSPALGVRFAPNGTENFAGWIDRIALGVLGKRLPTARRDAVFRFLTTLMTWRPNMRLTDIPAPPRRDRPGDQGDGWLASTIAAFVLDGPDWMLR